MGKFLEGGEDLACSRGGRGKWKYRKNIKLVIMDRTLVDWMELGYRNEEAESLMIPTAFLGNLVNDGGIH